MRMGMWLVMIVFVTSCLDETREATVSSPFARSAAEKSVGEFFVGLLGEYEGKVGSPYLVAMENFRQMEDHVPSELSRYLMNEVSVAIGKCDFLREYPRETLDEVLNEQKKTISDIFAGENVVGKLRVVEGILFGEYVVSGEEVVVYLRLQDVVTGENYGTVRGKLPKEWVPAGVSFWPGNYQQAIESVAQWQVQEETSDELQVKVRVDKGKSSYYRLGERLVVYCSANKECYLKLYLTSASGETQLIYPEAYERANTLNSGETREIVFRVKRPVGTEVIKAVASEKAFEYYEQPFEPLAEKENVEKVRMRGYAVRGLQREKVLAEDVCLYTILGEEQ